MNVLRIDPTKCDLCGTCEAILPNLLDKTTDLALMISPNNTKRHAQAIFTAIVSCRQEALSLEEMQ